MITLSVIIIFLIYIHAIINWFKYNDYIVITSKIKKLQLSINGGIKEKKSRYVFWIH